MYLKKLNLQEYTFSLRYGRINRQNNQCDFNEIHFQTDEKSIMSCRLYLFLVDWILGVQTQNRLKNRLF